MRAWLSCLIPLLLVVPTTAAPDAVAARKQVDALIQPVVDAGEVVGLSVGVLQDGRSWFRGYGQRSRSDRDAPTERDVFEIGSVSKAFTGAILADMVARGEVRLSDPVTKYLPDVSIAVNGRAITLLDLATHTSGLPRMPTNFKPKDIRNPYADYTADRLYAFLRKVQPARAPGARYEYSNLGVGLLGHALARAAKQPSYEALLRARICRPLGLHETRVTLDASMKRRLVQGHDGSGNEVPNWDIPLLAGAGGIRSTCADMIRIVRACSSGTDRVARAFQSAAQQRHAIDAARGIGLGWHRNNERPLVWHNGQTGGYHGFVGWDPTRKVGVVLLANSGNGLVTRLGVKVMEALQGGKPKPVRLVVRADVSEAALEKLVGRYALKSGKHIVISRRGKRLFGKGPDGSATELVPRSATVFQIKGRPGTVSFVFEGERVKELRVRLGGGGVRAERVR